MKGKSLFALALIATGVVMSCSKEIAFDQEGYDRSIANSFVVKNVDPNHQWATVGTADASITFNGEYGTVYDVGIYLDNPIKSQQATLLYEEKVNGAGTVSAPLSLPLSQGVVYVGVFDQQGRGMAQAVKVVNGQISATIGGSASNAPRRAAENAATYPDYVKTFADYLNPQKDLWGNQLNTTTVSTSDFASYIPFTDSDIEANSTLTNGSWVWHADLNQSIQEFLGGGDGKHFRVAAGTTITKTFHVNATWGVVNDVVIYVEGTMHVNGNTLNGPTIIIGNGGEMIVDGETNMSNAGRILVMAGGKITGAEDAVFRVNNGGINYNGGSIKFNGELNVNGSDFYNAGGASIDVDLLRNTSGGKFTNFGSIKARTNTIAGDTYNSTVINGCHMAFTENAGIGTLTMLDNSRLDVGGQAEFAGTQTLYKNSVVNAGSLYVTNTSFNGPTASNEFAIVKTNKILIGRSGDIGATGNTYFDWDKAEIYNKQNVKFDDAFTNTSSEGYWAINYQVTKYIDEATVLSQFTIPAGECTGDGYNDGGNDGGGKPETVTFSRRYCFEDNFPEAGDYDFNDVVLTVSPSLTGKTLTLKVSIDAVGATKTIGAAIRFIGVKTSDLASYTVTKGFTSLPGNLEANYHNIEASTGFLAENQSPNNTSSLVLVMFKDAHWAINPTLANDGSIENVFFNTVERNTAGNKKYVEPKEATYTLVFNDEEKAKTMLKENLYDVFIVEPYGSSYWEVHTVQNGFKTAQVITSPKPANSAGKTYEEAYGSNMPWAIQVPSAFQYPVEWQVIGTKEGGALSGAYKNAGHSFGEWAENSATATDWYNYPTSSLVFK